MTAPIAQVDLATIDAPAGKRATAARPTLPEALLADIRAQTDRADRADREITDGHARQAVVTAAPTCSNTPGWAPSRTRCCRPTSRRATQRSGRERPEARELRGLAEAGTRPAA